MVKIVPLASDVEAEPIVWARYRRPRAHQPEQRHGHDRGGDRGRDGEADAQAEVGVGRAEDEAEHDTRDHGARGELGDRLAALHPLPRGARATLPAPRTAR
jgi:hypothetical protein